MKPLQSEYQRLYGWVPRAPGHGDLLTEFAKEPEGQTRCLVLSLTRSPRWDELSQLWRGVQSELGLPAPAIAVAGDAGLQLWFSLAEPVAPQQALAFLDALRLRFMPDVRVDRVHGDCHQGLRDAPVPAQLDASGRWSSFVAADLAAVFDDTPWLDVKPSEEGQAALLRGLATTDTQAFEQAFQVLGLHAEPWPVRVGTSASPPTGLPLPLTAGLSVVTAAEDDPRRFLLQVMNDSSVALALRIEAAKTLLQHASSPAGPRRGD